MTHGVSSARRVKRERRDALGAEDAAHLGRLRVRRRFTHGDGTKFPERLVSLVRPGTGERVRVDVTPRVLGDPIRVSTLVRRRTARRRVVRVRGGRLRGPRLTLFARNRRVGRPVVTAARRVRALGGGERLSALRVRAVSRDARAAIARGVVSGETRARTVGVARPVTAARDVRIAVDVAEHAALPRVTADASTERGVPRTAVLTGGLPHERAIAEFADVPGVALTLAGERVAPSVGAAFTLVARVPVELTAARARHAAADARAHASLGVARGALVLDARAGEVARVTRVAVARPGGGITRTVTAANLGADDAGAGTRVGAIRARPSLETRARAVGIQSARARRLSRPVGVDVRVGDAARARAHDTDGFASRTSVSGIAKAFARVGVAHAAARARITRAAGTHLRAPFAAVSVVARARSSDVVARPSRVAKRVHRVRVEIRGHERRRHGARTRGARIDVEGGTVAVLRRAPVESRGGASSRGVTPSAPVSFGARAARQRGSARVQTLAQDVQSLVGARRARLFTRLRRRAVPARVVRRARRARIVR